MRKAFQYRLYPTKAQITDMCNILEDCRWLYNHFLGERKNSYEQGIAVKHYDQLGTLVDLKKHVNFTAFSQTLQNVGVRVELAYQAFFRRCKNGEKPGYPRFKSYGRYDSFTYPQSGFQLIKDRLYLSKIGEVNVRLHRSVLGKIKTVTIKRSRTNKWFVTFSCEDVPAIINNNITGSVGIDVGLTSFATLSNGSKVENPRFFKHGQDKLAVAQRRFSKTEKRSVLRSKRRFVVARIHERIANQRKDFVYKLARMFANKYKTICIEDLNINRMTEDCRFSKSIHDAAWAMFFQVLKHKAEEAGGSVIPVNPAYTSQDCSRCGTRVLKTLDERTHRCDCGLVLDRDHNAALNILAAGQRSLASA